MAEDKLKILFAKEFADLARDPQPVVLEMRKLEAWMLFSEIQLALRHPKNTGPSRDYVVKIAKEIERQIAVTPALKEVAAKGWDPQYDSEF